MNNQKGNVKYIFKNQTIVNRRIHFFICFKNEMKTSNNKVYLDDWNSLILQLQNKSVSGWDPATQNATQTGYSICT